MAILISYPMMLLLLLAVPFANGVEQNMCGAGFSGAALSCGTACPGGTDSECPSGESCFSLVDCPVASKSLEKNNNVGSPTRSPVRGFRLGDHEKQIIGYYASWQWYDRSKLAKPANMDFSKVTRVNFAFFQLDEEGNIWGTDEWGDPRVLFGDINANAGDCRHGTPRCRCSWVEAHYKSCAYHFDSTGLISMAHKAGTDIYPSIGGWTLSDAFSPMAADSTNRKIFARNCRNLIVDYGFDGIDLDWEYPGYAAHSGTPADKKNFNLLLQDVRKELDTLGDETGRFYGLTAALPCGPSNIVNIDIETVSQYLTEFNLMSYDFHGAWDPKTGVNSPLYDQVSDPQTGWSVDGCVKNWVARGAPQEKVNIGLGFYGRSFRGAKGLDVAHVGTDDSSWEIDEGTPQYFNIMDQIDEMSIEWDNETETPYAYFNDGKGGLVSYDDEQSICLKTEYAIRENLNGFIIWELSGDVMEDLTTPLLDMINRKLSETDTNCADPFGPKLPSPIQVTAKLPPMTATVLPEVTTTTTEIPNTTTKLPNTTSEATTTTSSTTTTTSTARLTTTASTTSFTTTSSASTQGATLASSSMDSLPQFIDGRKPVKRDEKKPNKPYRPPKELRAEL
mmetsp:Transcript_12350/g.22891  ORF Transcript_12350/g.22891 Transcript_12350/m.22891 type:complete len:619 (+) Transcript_12350:133-1989(+)|eukprot:CAMPEP_0201886968 /NCGR_PEP_ID=MMETSP0902-20130614/23702_1 /ASSEMBLY_ACC=CAM_ASM_000551 /TAXON_ID=420261 /ORGANISM="Thalassiosira antarctica, Strain CCMP982" /LENGTH=618 /DNA_ID=CAMNT_0048416743 /DNA_START=46 /DNA_END=1902 /DNA_ORIENTATION=-